MKLRLTLLTAATLTALSFSAHAVEKGTIMIMVNNLVERFRASYAIIISKITGEFGIFSFLSHFLDKCVGNFRASLGGCRIVSQQELADLKSPPNPHMANIDQTWQKNIVPQVVENARPVAELMAALQAEKDVDAACKTLGYRSQEENPCIFYVKVEGSITNIDAKSRSGKMTITDISGTNIVVQTGPTLRGTLLRDAYKGASYEHFNDQVLFGEYGRAINEQAINMIQSAKLKTGETVQVYGVFSAWDIPQTIPDITPAKIARAGGE